MNGKEIEWAILKCWNMLKYIIYGHSRGIIRDNWKMLYNFPNWLPISILNLLLCNSACYKLYRFQIFQKRMYLWKERSRISWSNKTGYTSRNTPTKVRANNSYISYSNVLGLHISLYLSNYIVNTSITSVK